MLQKLKLIKKVINYIYNFYRKKFFFNIYSNLLFCLLKTVTMLRTSSFLISLTLLYFNQNFYSRLEKCDNFRQQYIDKLLRLKNQLSFIYFINLVASIIQFVVRYFIAYLFITYLEFFQIHQLVSFDNCRQSYENRISFTIILIILHLSM